MRDVMKRYDGCFYFSEMVIDEDNDNDDDDER